MNSDPAREILERMMMKNIDTNDLEKQIKNYYSLQSKNQIDAETTYTFNLDNRYPQNVLVIKRFEREWNNNSIVFISKNRETIEETIEEAYDFFNTKRNLCSTCKSNVATCIATKKVFGDGIGHDNVMICSSYKAYK